VVQRDAGVLVGVGAALRREHDGLARQGDPGEERAGLQHGGGVAEDDVDGAGHGALAVELPERVRVQRVLVGVHAAAVQRGKVRVHPQRHRLAPGRARRVAERDVARQETLAGDACMHVHVRFADTIQLFPYNDGRHDG